MKILIENWKKFLSEGMKSADDLPDGYAIEVVGDNREINFIYTKDGERLWGMKDSAGDDPAGHINIALADKRGFGKCLDAYYITHVEAKSGWGPLLYDLAMEFASRKGGGLTADRWGVSEDAHKVWKYYDSQRSDIESAQLDTLPDSEHDQLTPNNPEDDCLQQSSVEWANANGGEWYDSPVSKVFRSKSHPTLVRLLNLGKISSAGAAKFRNNP